MTYFKHRHAFRNKLYALTVKSIAQRMTGDACTLCFTEDVGWTVWRETCTGRVMV